MRPGLSWRPITLYTEEPFVKKIRNSLFPIFTISCRTIMRMDGVNYSLSYVHHDLAMLRYMVQYLLFIHLPSDSVLAHLHSLERDRVGGGEQGIGGFLP